MQVGRRELNLDAIGSIAIPRLPEMHEEVYVPMPSEEQNIGAKGN
jgi:hypothetical protein